MHILIISSEPYLIPTVPLGGIFQQHQAMALHGHGMRVGVASGGLLPLRDLLSFRGRPRRELQSGVAIARRFRKSVLPLRFCRPGHVDQINVGELTAAVEQYMRDNGRPDCIHAHNLQYAGIVAAQVAERHRIPFVITEHNSSFLTGSYPQALAPQFAQALRASACNIAVSSALAKRLNVLFGKLAQPFMVVPNVIETDFAGAVVAAPPGPFTFLSIGRLDTNKNHALLLRAFAAAFKGQPVLLRIGGHGHEQARLRTLADDLGIARQVTFLGLLSRQAVASEMTGAHCFVLPSIKETFGVVVIEALSFGMPVIAAPSGGPGDIIDDANGIITADHADHTMADALRTMREHYGRYDRHAIARATVERFSPRAFCSVMAAIYQTAASTTKDKA
ncbi:glycosyltransferase [Massilia sp. TSP1-1-2]|uniref:glycosyltransferase n=1 Tax=Massilia sp. TSP1-1-2 TaxID=2804649 RepID=UPI003CF60796